MLSGAGGATTDDDEQVLVHKLFVLGQMGGTCNMVENERNSTVRSSKPGRETI